VSGRDGVKRRVNGIVRHAAKAFQVSGSSIQSSRGQLGGRTNEDRRHVTIWTGDYTAVFTAIIGLTWYGQRWNERWELLFRGARIITKFNIRRGLAATRVKKCRTSCSREKGRRACQSWPEELGTRTADFSACREPGHQRSSTWA
jgi:hypothetical protein